jgi:hypothetical protein
LKAVVVGDVNCTLMRADIPSKVRQVRDLRRANKYSRFKGAGVVVRPHNDDFDILIVMAVDG